MCALVRLSFFLFTLLVLASPSRAVPIPFAPQDTIGHPSMSRRGAIVKDLGGSIIIVNSATGQLVPQVVASDGGGTDYDAAALVWLIGSFVIGLPLAVVGVRGWRLTLGAAVSLALGVSAWAAFVNTISGAGIPDIALTGIVAGFMVIGFAIGLFEFGRMAGIAALGAVGGLALGIRIVLFKENLLVDAFVVNWVISALCGLGGLVMVFLTERIAIVLLTASTGTFLIGLGVDLSVNKQSGLSRGLRFLFDRNSSHLATILSTGYNPTLSTQINLGVSLALIPLFAFLQHKIFREPFDRTPPEEQAIDFDPDVVNTSQDMVVPKPGQARKSSSVVLKSRFSGFSTL